MRDSVPHLGFRVYSGTNPEKCNDSRSFSIHTMEAMVDGLPKQKEWVDLRTCDPEMTTKNDLLIRTKYISSMLTVDALKWDKNFERGREDTLTGVVVDEVVKGIEYMKTSSNHYIRTLPPPLYGKRDDNNTQLITDILKRMKDCGMFTSSECRFKSETLVRTFRTEKEHAKELVSHLLFEPMIDRGVYQDEMRLTSTTDPGSGWFNGNNLSDVLADVSSEDATKLILNPFQCWFQDTNGKHYRIVPNEIRWGLVRKKCDEVFKYVKPYFYCSSFDTTRLVPYKPAIGIFVDRERCPLSYAYLTQIIRSAALKKGLVGTDENFVTTTHELAIQYFDVKGKDDSYYNVTGGLTNPEENREIHAVLDSILEEERWYFENDIEGTSGPSIMTILDKKSPAFDEKLRNEILRSARRWTKPKMRISELLSHLHPL